jgi:multidrug efflux system outer membrane protein
MDRTWPFLGFMTALSMFCFSGLGCKVGPNYQPPQPHVPSTFPSATTTQATSQPTTGPASSQPVNLTRWWASLDDPLLNSLIERAVKENLDLGIAVARVEEVRAQRMVVASALWPTVNVFSGGPGRPPMYNHVSGTRQYHHYQTTPGAAASARLSIGPSGFLGPPGLELTSPGRHPSRVVITPGSGNQPGNISLRPALLSGDGQKSIIDRDEFSYDAGFDMTWELDVFGGIRRAIEAADADLQVAAEFRNDVLVILLSDVARTYVELRGLQQRLDIAQRNIQAQRRTVSLVLTRFRNGLTSDLDVALAQRQLAATESRVPIIQAAISQSRHRLAVLLGLSPEELNSELSVARPLPKPPPEVPTGLPSDILRRRPDLRLAERQLAAATARIGVAVADLYPRFMLNGSFGLQTSDIRKIFDTQSIFGSAGPGMRWPIFEGGRIVSNIYVQETRTQEALLNYRRTLLVALQEVDDALANYTGQRDSSLKLFDAVQASIRALKRANERYDEGVADFLNVLDAERSLYELEDQYAVSEQNTVVQWVALYKALGGGWEGYPMSQPATRPWWFVGAPKPETPP